MKILNLIVLLFIVVLLSCRNSDYVAETPSCITELIDKIKSEPVRNPSGSVWQYKYNGRIVYYISANCCDQYNILVDGNCNLICHPDGGFTGTGDGQCKDFNTNKSDEKLIWKDPRK